MDHHVTGRDSASIIGDTVNLNNNINFPPGYAAISYSQARSKADYKFFVVFIYLLVRQCYLNIKGTDSDAFALIEEAKIFVANQCHDLEQANTDLNYLVAILKEKYSKEDFNDVFSDSSTRDYEKIPDYVIFLLIDDALLQALRSIAQQHSVGCAESYGPIDVDDHDVIYNLFSVIAARPFYSLLAQHPVKEFGSGYPEFILGGETYRSDYFKQPYLSYMEASEQGEIFCYKLGEYLAKELSGYNKPIICGLSKKDMWSFVVLIFKASIFITFTLFSMQAAETISGEALKFTSSQLLILLIFGGPSVAINYILIGLALNEFLFKLGLNKVATNKSKSCFARSIYSLSVVWQILCIMLASFPYFYGAKDLRIILLPALDCKSNDFFIVLEGGVSFFSYLYRCAFLLDAAFSNKIDPSSPVSKGDGEKNFGLLSAGFNIKPSFAGNRTKKLKGIWFAVTLFYVVSSAQNYYKTFISLFNPFLSEESMKSMIEYGVLSQRCSAAVIGMVNKSFGDVASNAIETWKINNDCEQSNYYYQDIFINILYMVASIYGLWSFVPVWLPNICFESGRLLSPKFLTLSSFVASFWASLSGVGAVVASSGSPADYSKLDSHSIFPGRGFVLLSCAINGVEVIAMNFMPICKYFQLESLKFCVHGSRGLNYISLRYLKTLDATSDFMALRQALEVFFNKNYQGMINYKSSFFRTGKFILGSRDNMPEKINDLVVKVNELFAVMDMFRVDSDPFEPLILRIINEIVSDIYSIIEDEDDSYLSLSLKDFKDIFNSLALIKSITALHCHGDEECVRRSFELEKLLFNLRVKPGRQLHLSTSSSDFARLDNYNHISPPPLLISGSPRPKRPSSTPVGVELTLRETSPPGFN